MSELPAITSELVRSVARVLSGYSVEQWRALAKEERIPYARTARLALTAERRFLEKARLAPAAAGEP
jgi:hypothetical protein